MTIIAQVLISEQLKNYHSFNIYARDSVLGTHILDNVLQVMFYFKCT